ncbi:hypothetical protein [Beggiatoa leptomitoformis]|uniref:Uncharacterized protein n=1 Tax=Beggiatoa leptomitoformis TaxID=288004 RepID=A0A2N9YH77_9GAMM|nr:hypothetical protein [Beggiatoa leptomitoformis]ALG67862.1 hypothetical protein AL038_09260 [Beggiatoa leptomitoformis]AUI69878.1 hypothetical protein BLE401_15040 [Beggiatoa leptomitoformis]
MCVFKQHSNSCVWTDYAFYLLFFIGLSFTFPAQAADTTLPQLEGASGLDTTGESFSPNVIFSGGNAVAGQSYQTTVTQSLNAVADVKATIQVDPTHIGEKADIFVFAVTTLSVSTDVYYFMLGEGLYIDLWDQYTNTIVPFIPNVTLTATQSLSLYQGKFFYPGKLDIYFGYRLLDGTFIYNYQPISITITDTTTEPTPDPDPSTDAINGIPALTSYAFKSEQSKTIQGTSTENATGFNCSGTIKATDQIGRLALVSLFYQNGCYTDGTYNNNNYLVEKGTLNSSTQQQFEAYQIHEPSSKAQAFLASEHAIYYQFPTQEDYTVYSFNNNGLVKVADIAASAITLNEFTPIKSLTVSKVSGSVIYVFIPATQRISPFTALSTNVEAAHLTTTALGTPFKYRYNVNGLPFDTKQGFPYSPSDHANIYAQPRQFFFVRKTNGQIGIVWQNQADHSIQLTWLSNDLQSYTTITLNNNGMDLAVATGDDEGFIYYLTIQSGNGAQTDSSRVATLYKSNENGVLSTSLALDTAKTGLNIVSFDTDNVASLRYAQGKLGLIIGRLMHTSNDGLNHQGAIAVTFDANTLALLKNFGQTSGHSFENILTTNSQNEFVGVDLGDNYPRGINLHKFTDSRIDSRVIYTFKTQHGTTATSPAGKSYPLYSEISDSSHTYYKWSNDNNTYSELGGVIEGQQGYTVIFAGEKSPTGVSLDNSRVGSYLNDPRNLGIVQVIHDFASITPNTDNEVPEGLILTDGLTETGGFYTFNGTWSPQRNTGVVWLTNYQDKTQANVSRLKSVKLNDGNILLLWELWTDSQYVNTYMLKISEQGQKRSDIIALGTEVRLNRTDDILVNDNTVYIVNGNKSEKKLELIALPLTN